MNIEQRLDFLRAGLGVNRYHQKYTSVKDTVGKHSAGVAGFLLMMYGEKTPSGNLLAAAICHDLAECVVGDIPSPTKRSLPPEVAMAVEQAEEALLVAHKFYYDLEYSEEQELKMADCFDGLMFCIEEVNRGNLEVVEVGDKYISYLYSPTTEWSSVTTDIFNVLNRKWKRAVA